jgi:hypothetical protein
MLVFIEDKKKSCIYGSISGYTPSISASFLSPFSENTILPSSIPLI